MADFFNKSSRFPGSIGLYRFKDLEITASDFSEKNGTIQLFVKADKNGIPLGLGSKNVRWEKLRFIRPSIKNKENLKLAIAWIILQIRTGLDAYSLESVGNSTLIVYPDAGSGNTTCDGFASRSSVNETFSTILNGAGTTASTTAANMSSSLVGSATTNQFQQLQRIIITLDTSPLTSNSTINSASLNLWGLSQATGIGSTNFHIVSSSPASNNTIVAADYAIANFGSTSFGSLAQASFVTAAYNSISLNSDGLAAISKTGITKLAIRTEWDLNGSFTGTWASNQTTRITISTSDVSGTSQDPYILIDYTDPDIPATSLKSPSQIQSKLLGMLHG